jgi:tetratricopeptide (TPR) repeat protein
MRVRRDPGDLAVALAAGLAYAPTLGGTTVWDDEFLTTRNPYLAPSQWGYLVSHDLWVASAKHEPAGYYRPLGTLSLAVSRLISNEPWSYHLGNVVLHVAVAFLLRRLVLAHRPAARFAATAAALAFALAPITSEAVEWLSGRFDLLGTLFLLGALWANAGRRHALAVVAFAAALFAKETLVMTPVLLALDDALHRRVRLRTAVFKYGACAAAFGLYVLARTAAAVPSAAVSGSLVSAEALRSYTGAVTLYGATLARTIAPSIFHVYRDPGTVHALVVAGVLALVTVGAAGWARREPAARGALLGWLGALAALVPVGLTAPRLYQTGDRYAYAPVALLLFGLALAVAALARRRALAAHAASALLLVFAAAGVPSLLRRHQDWADEEHLFRVELERDPSRSWAALLLGEMAARRGDYATAQRLLESARTGIPRPHRVEIALCYVALNQDQLASARAHCDAALALEPDDPRGLTNRANVRLLQGDADGALDDARHALRVKPQSVEAHAIAADALFALGRLDEARAENDAALALSPGHARSLKLRSVIAR